MKRLIVISLLLILILSFPFANKVLKAEYQDATIESILCTNGINSQFLPLAMTDGDFSSTWRTTASSPAETALVITLAQPVKVTGLKLNFSEINFDEIEVEYYDELGWHTFTGQSGIRPSFINQWFIIDLSYDQVTTDKLRIHIYNRNHLPYIGSISELRILGYPDTFRKNVPVKTVTTFNSQELFRVENLCDGNTNSAWETKPDFNGNASVEFTIPQTKISQIKLFMKSNLKGILSLEYQDQNRWLRIPGCEGITDYQLREGWNLFQVPGITADKIRLVLTNPTNNRLGGINEIQVWGESTGSDKEFYDSGIHRLELGKTIKERTIRLHIPNLNESSLYYLIFTTNGQLPDTMDLNRNRLQNQSLLYQTAGAKCYRIPISSLLIAGDNYLKLGSNQTIQLFNVRIEEVKNTGALSLYHRNPSLLTDGFCYTAASENSIYDVDYKPQAQVDWVQIYSNTPLNNIRVQADNGRGWEDIYTVQTQYDHFLHIDIPYGVTAQRMRYILPYNAMVYEINSWGSWVSGEQPPRIKNLYPTEGIILPVTQTALEVSGIIDQLDATVRVNGKMASFNGEKFATILDLNQGAVHDINIEAQTQRNGVTVERRRVFRAIAPEFSLDQKNSVYYVNDKSFTISGVGNAYCDRIVINNNQVRMSGGRFSYDYQLLEGINLITINAYDKQGIYSSKEITVYYDTKAPLISVKTPLAGELVGSNAIEVSGSVVDLTPVTVKVNGEDAVVDGASFKAVIKPTLGMNYLQIVATDKLGNSNTSTLKFEYDELQPKLSILYPADNQVLKSGNFILRGTVYDNRNVKVQINGHLVNIVNQSFQTALSFPEGQHKIEVIASNNWGYKSVSHLNIIVDETAPEEFTIITETTGWSNDNQPVIHFLTKDRVSGIDHYELKLDDQEFQVVTSPYRFAPLTDGEHTVVVKAIDRAGWETESTAKLFIDTTPPVEVTNFKAVPGPAKVNLSWNLNPEDDITRYVITRIPGFPDQKEKIVGPTVTEFIDTEVTDLTSYTYSIRAIDRADNFGLETTLAPVKAGLAEVTVDPKKETKVEFENVVIEVPEGALTEEKTLTVMEVQNADVLMEKSMAVNVSPVYSLSAKTAGEFVDPNGVTFEKPVMVGIHFNLDGVQQFLKKGNLRAYYYNPAAGNWEVIPESFVDGDRNIVYFFTRHFSMFSVQASVATPLAPEQISEMGISPGKAYYQNNQVNISYGSGSVNVTAKDFVLPGKGGLDLTISRSYDSQQAQADWGIEENNLFSTLFGFIDANRWLSIAKNLIARSIDKYLAKPAGSYGFGRGWRMNFVWIEKDENGQFVHLPGGAMKKIHWKMSGPGWGGQGYGIFECHAGEHFILEQTQRKVGDVYSTIDSSPVKVGENWETTGYTLTTKDGTRYYLDGNGLIQRIVNRLGNSEINFYYQGKQVDYIIDSVGRKIQFKYSGKFIQSITAAGKTVSYFYNNQDELVKVNDGGVQETKYDYELYKLSSGSQTVSIVDIVTCFFNPKAWVGLLGSLVPDDRKTDVYYLSRVETPYKGEYRFTYEKQNCIRYGDFGKGLSLSIGVAWFEYAKVSQFQENGSAYQKTMHIDYDIRYDEKSAPIIATCTVTEGDRRTLMLFDRFSNSVDEDTSLLKTQVVYGKQDKIISSHTFEYDYELEAPIKVTDNTGGRSTVQEFKYDNWGNVIWQKNHHTKVESFYSYANTNAPKINHAKGLVSPYDDQELDNAIHDARTGELILNYNGDKVIPQQVFYKYAKNGNLLEKAVRSDSKWLRTAYDYDDTGNIIKTTSPTGIETFYEYSPDYQKALLTKVILGRLKDADGNVQTNVVLKEVGYDPVTFRKRWEKDARGFVTEYEYDILGREVMSVAPDDTDSPDYRPPALEGPVDRSGQRADNPTQRIIYEDANRTTKVIDPMGNRTDYIYDAFEHLVEIVKYTRTLGIYIPYSRVKVNYDNHGNIAAIISPLGNKNPNEAYKYTTQYLYDEANRLSRIIYPDDTQDETDNPYKFFSYNEVDNSITVTEAASPTDLHQTLVRKDAVDRVIEQTAGYLSDGAATSKFGYDALGNKIWETDGRKHTTWFIYDDQNRLIKKILPETEVLNNPNGTPEKKSSELVYIYDDEGNLVQEISPLGRVVYHVYDEMNREIMTQTEMNTLNGSKQKITTKVYYDLAGNIVKTIDPNGKKTEYTYTARGWLASSKDPMDGVTSFTYDLVGNKLSETDPRGNAPGAPKNSYTAWYFYDDLYRVIRVVLPDQTPPEDPNQPGDNPVIRFEYDENGNCVKEIKANGQVINYTYNGRNWLLTQKQSLNGKEYQNRFEYDWIGNKRFIFDNTEKKTEFRYDAFNRLTLQIFPEGNTIEYEYDLSGNKHIVRDGKHQETIFDYDPLNRLYQVTDAEKKVSTNWYNEEGRLTKSVSATGLVTKFRVNEAGLPLEVTDSLGNRRLFDYDAAGNPVYKKDPRGTETSFEYDDLYRVLRADLKNGSRSQYLSYDYDPVGNIKKADNGQVQLIYNQYDGAFRSDPFNRIEKVEQVMPGGTRYTTEYRYDQLTGQMTGIRYPNSLTWLDYDYDPMGRLIALPGFAGTKSNPGFKYDANSALESVRTDNGITTTYQRDDNGRITHINAVRGNGLAVLGLDYQYDAANNIIQRNDNSYVYDKVNRLLQASIRGVFEDKFTKADLLLGTVDQDYYGDKDVEEDVTELTEVKLDYSARSLVIDLLSEAENISKLELTPEKAGHRVPVDQIEIYYRNGFAFTKLERNRWVGTKDASGRITVKFTPLLTAKEIKVHCNYDDLDFLQLPVDKAEFFNSPEKLITVYQKVTTRTETYEYDGMGNRTLEKLLLKREHIYEYKYYENSNRLKTNGRYAYQYDANGNLIKKGNKFTISGDTVEFATEGEGVEYWEYSYDLLNQLEQVKKNGEVVSSYTYDPNGFRVEKVGSKGKIHYVPLLNGEVGYRKEFTSGKEYSFIYVGIQHLARVNGVIGGSGKKFYYHNDHLGSAMSVTDEDGNIVVERDFSPFGEKIKVADSEEPYPDETEDGFTGKDFDEDIGLYYYNARWYDPTVGKFITEDSVADDPNLYSYCGQNPVNAIDPTGHFSIGPVKFQSGFGLFMASVNVLAAITGEQMNNSFWTAISSMSSVKGMKDFAEYLKLVRKIETTLSNTVNPDTGEKYTQKEIITFMRRLYYPDTAFDTACGSSIDEQRIANMLEEECPGVMKSLGFSKRRAIYEYEKYRSSEEIWRVDKTKFDVYGEKVDIGHIWTGIDAGINADNINGTNLKIQGLKIANSVTNNTISILGVTVTGDLVSRAGFGEGDIMGDLYGAVLGNDMTMVKNINNFSISNHLAQYFSPNGRWFRVASDFIKIYGKNPTWSLAVNAASINLRGKPIGLLRNDPYFIKNSEIFTDYLSKLVSHGR